MPGQPTDNIPILLRQVAQGDETAFRKLFHTYYNELGAFIKRLSGSEPLTQEIVQDVFLKVWINRAALMQVTCFRAYLFTVAKNHAFNCLKQIARERTRRQEWLQAVLHQASLSEEGDSSDSGRLLDEAVELLPSQQRKVYTLSRQQGIRQAEIARKLNISHETVKKHMVLALRFLKNHLRTHAGMLLLLLADFLEG